jgi:DNA-binding transcriptional LysR family regulator
MDNARLRRYFRHGMFTQLIAFEACIRHGSVTRAGEELSLAQPTVSCLIKKLSDTMGVPLTMSRERRIAPTPLGVEVLALCQELFEAFAGFDERLRRVIIDAHSPESPHGDHPA